jgi:hypothetical protein
MAVSSLVAIAWLVRNYLAAPQHDDLRLVFGMPALLLYTQAGFLFARQIVVAWRMPVPEIQAEEHLEAREATRKFYLKVCDIIRAMNAVALLAWPAMLSVSPSRRMQVAIIWKKEPTEPAHRVSTGWWRTLYSWGRPRRSMPLAPTRSICRRS